MKKVEIKIFLKKNYEILYHNFFDNYLSKMLFAYLFHLFKHYSLKIENKQNDFFQKSIQKGDWK